MDLLSYETVTKKTLTMRQTAKDPPCVYTFVLESERGGTVKVTERTITPLKYVLRDDFSPFSFANASQNHDFFSLIMKGKQQCSILSNSFHTSFDVQVLFAHLPEQKHVETVVNSRT